MVRSKLFLPLLAFLLIAPSFAWGQSDFRFDKAIWPDDLRIRGTVIAWNGSNVPASIVDSFYETAAEDEAVIVSIWLGETPNESTQNLTERFKDAAQYEHFNIEVEGNAEYAKLEKLIGSATGVWINGSAPKENQCELLDSLKPALNQLLRDGHIVVVAGEAFDWAGHTVVQKGEETDQPLLYSDGMNLFPDTVITKKPNEGNAVPTTTLNARLVRASVSENTGMILAGRKIRTKGDGSVEFRLMANSEKPARVLAVEQFNRRPNPYTDLIDLTAWRRDAIDRTLPQFPPAEIVQPNVENGTLLIVGGGGMPKGLFDEFIELAGGKNAKLIYVPCSEAETVPRSRLVSSWRRKVASAHMLHTKDRTKADTDEEFLKHLSEATGIWFGGGRQWNFVDSYYGTKAHQLMLDVLDRGGVVGGSSAGASIQGEYLARANPVANFDIMAPGYERGLGFISGVAIDQHFSQRRRHKDMSQLVDTYPQLLGIGLDEATAIVVQKSEAKVVGRGRVFFYDRNQPVVSGEDDFIALSAGQKFDLAKRELIEEASDDDEARGGDQKDE